MTSLQFVRALVERGANVNARLDKGVPRAPSSASLLGMQGSTPFLMAADRADLPLMRVLRELGADPFLPNTNKTTPLMAAAGFGTADPLEEAGTEPEALEATEFLLDLGADINVWKQPDKQGRSPLFIAEGFKAGRQQPSRPTIEAFTRLMLAAGLSTDGPRPQITDIYARPTAPSQKAPQP